MTDTTFGSLLIVLALTVGTATVTLLILVGVNCIFNKKNSDSNSPNRKPTQAELAELKYWQDVGQKQREQTEKRRQEKQQQMAEERMIRELVENDVKTSLLNSLEVRARSGDIQAFKEWVALRNSK